METGCDFYAKIFPKKYVIFHKIYSVEHLKLGKGALFVFGANNSPVKTYFFQ